MCGISGLVGEIASREIALRMAGSMQHRGPDGFGVWDESGVTLAHRRLSIIDVEGGQQPMVSASGRWVLIFNGEVYNFLDLRANALKGYPFKTRSDTEVVLAALERWGAEALGHLEGMFAIAAWDRETRKLLLARDPQGIKPLYYASLPRGTVFGSEIASIFVSGLRPEVDERNLDVFLDMRYVPSPFTLFRGVMRIPPGHAVWIDESGTPGDFFTFSLAAPLISHVISLEDLKDTIKESLISSIQRQLISDVPVGVLLSGGVDSAIVAAAAVRAGRSISTFCIGYRDDHPSNEFMEARETAAFIGTEHHELFIDAGAAIESMPQIIKHLEEPLVTTSMFSYYLLCQEVAKYRKVVLTGQGADEPWGGYGRHRVAALATWLSPVVNGLPRFLPRLGRYADDLQRLRDALYAKSEVDQILGFHALFPGKSRELIRLNGDSRRSRDLIERMLAFCPSNGNRFERLLAFETRSSLPDNLLLLGDKLSMASSLEVRVPLLDPTYLKVVESVPGHLRRGGWAKHIGKLLHKEVCATLLPEYIVNRKKKGFQSPVEIWMRSGLGDRICELIDAPNSFCRTYLEVSEVRKIIDSHRAGGLGSMERQLFSFWILEEWYRAFFSNSIDRGV